MIVSPSETSAYDPSITVTDNGHASVAWHDFRNGNYDVYTVPAEGGEETRLTDAEGLDDGPDYSADGRYVYFNSERTGAMRIWRMDSNGANQIQVTSLPTTLFYVHLLIV